MPDEADIANDYAARELEQRILDVLKAKPVIHDGHCRNCAEPILVGAFCDQFCRTDFEARERHLKRAGAR